MTRERNHAIAGLLRFILAVVAVVLQLTLIVLLISELRAYAIYAYILIQFLSVMDVLYLLNKSGHTSYTVAWLVVILILPVFGNILYFLWGHSATRGRRSRQIRNAIRAGTKQLRGDPSVRAALEQAHPSQKRLSGFLDFHGFPAYDRTDCRYFPDGKAFFDALLDDLRQAKRFIFLEYFIIAHGELWRDVEEVLLAKAAEGVTVRLMFDDLGSLMTVPDHFVRRMRQQGIEVVRFNPVQKYISGLYINYRNHQKIAVIDGGVGYTGGVNIADEYVNLYEKHGHWKDTGIRLEGDAVWSLTVTFLQMWAAEVRHEPDYDAYRPPESAPREGFFQPFSDGPVNNPDNPAETLYRQILYSAKDYVYITTPYLVIERSMSEALCMAALGGADVRIVTPKHWDRWYTHMVTRSNYGELLRAGVKIYEYTPGYIHAKTVLCDDEHAVTGSINMDYRSFYLHFENGVWICGAPVLKDIKRDILETIGQCEEISLDDWMRRPRRVKAMQTVLRLFAVFL